MENSEEEIFQKIISDIRSLIEAGANVEYSITADDASNGAPIVIERKFTITLVCSDDDEVAI